MSWFLLPVLASSCASYAISESAVPAVSPVLAGSLDALLRRLPEQSATAAACVMDAATGQIVFQYRANEPMTPASAAKVFVMVAALKNLGPEFAFETVLGIRGQDLIVVGAGDPGFGDPELCKVRGQSVTAIFDAWAQIVGARGVSRWPGRLVLDDSIFDDERRHPTWPANDLGRWYAAGVTGLVLNDNCVEITVRPQPGGGTTWSIMPPLRDSVKVINGCHVGKTGKAFLHHDGGGTYRLSGTIRSTWEFESVPHPDPPVMFADALRVAFEKQGISIMGDVVRARVRRSDGSLPADVTVLSVHVTPLKDVFERIGRNSQNLFAECLLKRLGYEEQRRNGAMDPQGSWSTGSRALIEALRACGVDVTGLVVADGSGLSRANVCSARQLATALTAARRLPGGAMLRDSLAVPGQAGSLRTAPRELAPYVRAKTGTMSGVRTLAGYLQSRSGREYTFAILFNNYKSSSAPYRDIQTRFCNLLVDRLP